VVAGGTVEGAGAGGGSEAERARNQPAAGGPLPAERTFVLPGQSLPLDGGSNGHMRATIIELKCAAVFVEAYEASWVHGL